MFEDKITSINASIDAMPDEFEKRTYTVSEIQVILGIGRNTAYELVKTNAFRTVRIGGRIRVSKRSFDKWLDEKSQVCD